MTQDYLYYCYNIVICVNIFSRLCAAAVSLIEMQENAYRYVRENLLFFGADVERKHYGSEIAI